MNILVTGGDGFVGRNLRVALRRRDGLKLAMCDIETSAAERELQICGADVIVHLAGVNRPDRVEEFAEGNADLTAEICAKAAERDRPPRILFSSSIQADMDNPYGSSKRAAELHLERYAEKTGAEVVVFRLKNLFGKWCLPNYNSVTATYCHNISHDLPITISVPAREIELTYIDHVVAAFVAAIDAEPEGGYRLAEPLASRRISLGLLAERIRFYHAHRETLLLPDLADPFERALYATYLSYLEPEQLRYDLTRHSDERGSLAEFIKGPSFGQIFVSHSRPGVTRGNHLHDTKTEKFLVIQGTGLVRLRHVLNDTVIEHRVDGAEYQVVDIPPGFTHSIENIGEGDLVTVFWACEIFDREHPDTNYEPVLAPGDLTP